MSVAFGMPVLLVLNYDLPPLEINVRPFEIEKLTLTTSGINEFLLISQTFLFIRYPSIFNSQLFRISLANSR